MLYSGLQECVCVCVCVCVYVCVFSNILSETTGSTEAKFHVEPIIQMVQVICCSSLLSTSGGGL